MEELFPHETPQAPVLSPYVSIADEVLGQDINPHSEKDGLMVEKAINESISSLKNYLSSKKEQRKTLNHNAIQTFMETESKTNEAIPELEKESSVDKSIEFRYQWLNVLKYMVLNDPHNKLKTGKEFYQEIANRIKEDLGITLSSQKDRMEWKASQAINILKLVIYTSPIVQNGQELVPEDIREIRIDNKLKATMCEEALKRGDVNPHLLIKASVNLLLYKASGGAPDELSLDTKIEDLYIPMSIMKYFLSYGLKTVRDLYSTDKPFHTHRDEAKKAPDENLIHLVRGIIIS